MNKLNPFSANVSIICPPEKHPLFPGSTGLSLAAVFAPWLFQIPASVRCGGLVISSKFIYTKYIIIFAIQGLCFLHLYNIIWLI
jgi:hypothetical protein